MISLKLDRNADFPLYAQIREAIKKEIEEGRLNAGEKLPTVAVLSKKLGVTQVTVLRAYEDLINENCILTQVGRGTFVRDKSGKQTPTHFNPYGRFLKSPFEPADPEMSYTVRRLRMGIARSLEDLKILLERPGLIKFTSGVPDPEIADPDVLRRCTMKALEKGQQHYEGYIGPPGLEELREAIAERFRKRGAAVTRDHVLITNGSQQAVAILAQLALENNMRIICESPSYQGMPNAFGAIGHWVESLPRDNEGPIPGKFAKYYDGKPSMLYLCTLFHNPMGTSLSAGRGAMVKEWAEEQDSLVISDEIFCDLAFNGPDTSYFHALGEDRTIVIGSLSKSFMCGLRIGWMVTKPERIRAIAGLKRAMDIGSPSLMQGIAHVILASGEYEKHLVRAREHYRTRKETIIRNLEKNMPEGVTWTNPGGSMHLWVSLPPGYSSIALYLLAVERGVGFSPGPQLDIDHRFLNGFKLSYGSVSLSEIEEGVELLADAVKVLLAHPPADAGLNGLGDFL
ncbi:MAG: PLP-dependent aminotransferase family protein [Spirochaetales bacterium]|nr:PLP-dependent aminotransferase family protein [Spirochaetales bacterium]